MCHLAAIVNLLQFGDVAMRVGFAVLRKLSVEAVGTRESDSQACNLRAKSGALPVTKLKLALTAEPPRDLVSNPRPNFAEARFLSIREDTDPIDLRCQHHSTDE